MPPSGNMRAAKSWLAGRRAFYPAIGPQHSDLILAGWRVVGMARASI
jgi:hypothetical protein